MLDILIPHFEDPHGLSNSLNSILMQTWQGNKRIVIADDGSGNGSNEVLDCLIDSYRSSMVNTQFCVIRNPVNKGRAFTRNVLLDAIERKYVSWLDAGDEWYPNKLSAQFATFEAGKGRGYDEMTWLTCNYDWKWEGGKPKRVEQYTEQDQHKALLTGRNLRAYLWTLLGPACSFKSVGYFDENLPRLQDLDFFVRFVSHGGRIINGANSDSLCVYHKSDVGRDADQVRYCNAVIYNKHRVIFNRYGEQFKRARLYDMEMLSARFAQSNQDRAKTIYYLARAFKHRPWRALRHVVRNGLAV